MYSFDTYFRGNEVYINKKHQYLTNEILVQLLNVDFDCLKKIRDELSKLHRKLKLESDMNYDALEHYNRYAQEAQGLMRRVDAIARSIPFLKAAIDPAVLSADKLFDCLNQCGWVWQDRDSILDEAPEEDNDYGLYLYTGCDDGVGHGFYQTTFHPVLDHPIEDADMILSLEEENAQLKALFASYITLIDDFLRVQVVYANFIDNYLNGQNKFLNEFELAKAYGDFIKKTQSPGGKPYTIFSSGNTKMSHAILQDDKGRDILCEAYRFDTLGAFLYLDLFRGIASNFIPKRCLNCNRYFLIEAGKYSDYCEEPLVGDNTKTCRDVGARKKYGDKCKNDPVWLTYNRAYKAHYARYMKKKMTVAEFEQWSAWAVELRTQAEDGGVIFEEYERKIRK